jgi:hypothetical protein
MSRNVRQRKGLRPSSAVLIVALLALAVGGCGSGGNQTAQQEKAQQIKGQVQRIKDYVAEHQSSGGGSAHVHHRRGSSGPNTWTRCPRSGITAMGSYGTSAIGMPCRAATAFISSEGALKTDTGHKPGTTIRHSVPRSFNAKGFGCTSFPLADGSGWHAICHRAAQQISFYIRP